MIFNGPKLFLLSLPWASVAENTSYCNRSAHDAASSDHGQGKTAAAPDFPASVCDAGHVFLFRKIFADRGIQTGQTQSQTCMLSSLIRLACLFLSTSVRSWNCHECRKSLLWHESKISWMACIAALKSDTGRRVAVSVHCKDRGRFMAVVYRLDKEYDGIYHRLSCVERSCQVAEQRQAGKCFLQ